MQYALYVSEVLAVFMILMTPAIVRTMVEPRTALPTIVLNAVLGIVAYNTPGTPLGGMDTNTIWGIATLVVFFACSSVLCIAATMTEEEAADVL